MPIMDPLQLPAVASVRDLATEAMPPLWQYFSRPLESTRAHLRTQKRRPLCHKPFLLQNGDFLGAEMGPWVPIIDPPQLPAVAICCAS